MKRFNFFSVVLGFTLMTILTSCGDEGVTPPITGGNDPNFKIVANNDNILKDFTRKVEVFGISIYAVGIMLVCFLNKAFPLLIIGFLIFSFGQPFILNLSAKIATYWFLP